MQAKKPWQFIENQGQKDVRVRYYAQRGRTVLYLTENEIILDMIKPCKKVDSMSDGKNSSARPVNVPSSSPNEKKIFERQVIKLMLQNAESPLIVCNDRHETIYNYFIDSDPSAWRANVPAYGEIYYKGIYSGIDLRVYTADNGELEYDFIIAPGVDSSVIQVSIQGINHLETDQNGDLVMQAAFGEIRQRQPKIYQMVDGKKVDVSSGFNLIKPADGEKFCLGPSEFRYGFNLGGYDRTRQLVIDPLLSSTFIGGSDDSEDAYALKIDPSGNVYVAGGTESYGFPVTAGAYDVSYNGGKKDVFVSKFNNTLTTLVSSTFIGGDLSESANALAIDAAGNIIIAGNTDSDDYPVTTGAYDTTYNGGDDVFVSKLNSNLTDLLSSTFIGGTMADTANAVDIDAAGNVFVAGATASSNYPVITGAYDASYNGGDDVFVSKLKSDLTGLQASTFIGGSGSEIANAIDIDTSGNIFIAGGTDSFDYPVTTGVYDGTYNGGEDIFTAQLKNDLTGLVASTYIGGSMSEAANALVVEHATGNVFVTGKTGSSDCPSTVGAYDISFNGGSDDVYLAKLNNGLTQLLGATFLGGGLYDSASAIAVDNIGNVVIAGATASSNYPITFDAHDRSFNGGNRDAFVSMLNSGLKTLASSTYLGGSMSDRFYALGIDAAGNLFVAGYSWSSDFPSTTGTYDVTYNGAGDAVLSKLGIGQTTAPVAPSNLSAKATSSTQIMIGWKDNSTNETGFKIERKTGDCSSTNSWTQIATKSVNAKTHKVSVLTPNTSYSFRVRAYNSSGDSIYSNCVSAKTGKSDTPPAPSNFKAISISSTKVNLSWKDNSANENGFRIFRKAGAGEWTLIMKTAADTISFSDTTAKNNNSTKSYLYYICAYNSFGNSPSTYTATVPYSPTDLTATQGTTAGSIKLMWTDKSTNETGFEIYRKFGNCSSTSTWTKVATLGANKTTWTDTGRTPGSNYSYRIRAYKKSGSILSAHGYSMWTPCKSSVAP